MAHKKQLVVAEPPADPFQERRRMAFQERMQLMGGQFHFETDSPSLARIVRLAYANLPAHKFSGSAPRCLVRLILSPMGSNASRARPPDEPPRVRPLAGGGILCGGMDGANFVAVSPEQRSALLVVSRDTLRFPYHLRYEMLEFAVYVLASRVQGLVPLHAACVGRAGQGILLLGPSGSGKSTLSLHCLLQGIDFLAEDSVLVRPDGLLATGVANFLHVRPDSLRFLDKGALAAVKRTRSSVIRRRSGVEKLEIDLRRPHYRQAATPLRIGAVVFVSSRSADAQALLAPMPKAQLTRRLAAEQRYAASQPGWSDFTRQVARLPVFELRRGRHPLEAVEAIERLLLSASASGRRGKR
jgi:energy-coupling factor transporter ATP-binding protein EcfA2